MVRNFIITIACLVFLCAGSIYVNYYQYGKLKIVSDDLKIASEQLKGIETQKKLYHDMIVKMQTKLAKERQDFFEFAEEWIERLFNDIEELKKLNADIWGKEGLKDFESMEDLYRFLADDNTDKLEWTESGKWVCTDFALQLSKNAAKQGYRLYPTLVIGHNGNQITSLHVMNFAIVEKFMPSWGKDKFVIIVEPQTDEAYVFGRVLDDPSKWRTKWYKFLP
jgi:hypothetical protein